MGNPQSSPFDKGGLSQDPRYDPDQYCYNDSFVSDFHAPMPGYHQNQFSQSMGDLGGRGRSESTGMRSDRTSDDQAPLTTFLGASTWQHMSATLPPGVRDPLNIEELEREDYAAGPSSRMSHLTSVFGEKQGSRHLSQMSSKVVVGVATEKSGGEGDYRPIDWAYIQDHNLRTGGLPSLDQVLTRKTKAPLALRDFAVHCSVRQPQARRWLEFYMAARTHEKMCLAYESDLRHSKSQSQYGNLDGMAAPKSNRFDSSKADSSLIGDFPDGLRSAYASGIPADPAAKEAAHNATVESLSRGRPDDQIFYKDGASEKKPAKSANYRRSHRQSTRMALQIQTAAETVFLRYFRAALDPNLLAGGSPSYWPNTMGPTALRSQAKGDTSGLGSLKRMLTQSNKGTSADGMRRKNPKGLQLRPDSLRPAFNDAYHQGYGVQDGVGKSAKRNSGGDSKYDIMGGLASPDSLTRSREHLSKPIVDDSPNRYLQMQGTQRHIYYHMPWPPEILTDIEQRLLHDGAALDPNLFSEALLYAYDVLDTYYFPIFLSDATSRNVTRDHCTLRVFIAFILLWFGFALPLALILLDHRPKEVRIWCLVPQFIGWWNMAVGFGGCDILLAIMRKYQSPALRQQEVDESAASSDTFAAHGKTKWFGGKHVGSWRRAWFTTRVSVDMTATRMVRARSVRWFIGSVVMTAVSTAILCAVPGTHIYTN
ncbi:hypothetical protein DL89DRAFT_268613 [Linderina pennispora]|uniref:RGS domain-containing protein n=1 Tax=Linderina pennispora TaxID=61395 RepID=A0A1Y1W677_9FUNG|nr:uncharacterized protein DL89DRAFT_268613 [Linderina pennispora]ORX68848.1 hypothetical protein DL89DRAFT_268613 [Linderina pennispora]